MEFLEDIKNLIETTKYSLPVLLLATAFLMKLFIHEKASFTSLIQLGLEFPVDIAFLANSFVAAYIIDSGNNQSLGYLLVFIAITFLIVFCWKQSRNYFDSQKYVCCALLASFALYLPIQ